VDGRGLGAVVLAGAIGVAAATGLVWLNQPAGQWNSCGPAANGGTPLGTPPIVFSAPKENSAGVNHWYNFSYAGTGGAYRLGGLHFQVETASGANVTAGAGWYLRAMNATGGWVGTYSLFGAASGTWTSGATQTLQPGFVITLLATPELLAGDNLVVRYAGTAPCAYAGSEQFGIP
jgi:hypothetical protein